MINVFFVPGMFGSTVEFLLRNYSSLNDPIEGKILKNGSMHSFAKQYHPCDELALTVKPTVNVKIATPIYPVKELHLPEILEKFKSFSTDNDNNILIYADSNVDAEINMLFMYYKVILRTAKPNGFTLLCGENQHNITSWNPAYTHWSEMHAWELREWFSIFYEDWTQEWISSFDQVPNYFLKIKNTDILFFPQDTFDKILSFCNLDYIKDPSDFLNEWQFKQQYVVDEFMLINQIVESTVAQKEFTWSPLNLVSEAIIQNRLRKKNFELCCYDLNTFPTNSNILYNLLEKC